MTLTKITTYVFLVFSLLITYLAHGSGLATVDHESVRFGIYAGYLGRFPDTKGIRWSDNIAHKIFTDKGMNIDIEEFPAKRLTHSLATDKIDTFVSSRESLGQYSNVFLQAKLPASVTTWYIYYDHTKGWIPDWPPDQIFKEKIGESQQSAQSLRQFFQMDISQAAGFEAIVEMVNLGRADYWLESRIGIRSVSPDLLKSTAEGFTSRPLFSRGIYMFFQDTDRGRRLKKVYDEGLEKMLEDGLYVKTYYQYDTKKTDTFTTDETITFIRDEYPDVNIPKQQQP
ncbi:MAG: hypothetical protein ACI92E_000338 [Oceanicoccus sp.]|jgi:hypothetical protein